jgi:hypothetical protein
MEHFSEQEWVDLVRGVPPQNAKTGRSEVADRRSDLESHLASGCADCASMFNLWKHIYSVATHESSYCPPESIVRMAKMEFAARQVRETPETVEACLVFDTLLQPILAGVRSASAIAAARQTVYEGEGLTVDLRFDRQPYSSKVHLIGQVLDSGKFGDTLANFPAVLWTEKGLHVAESRTNDFGEFHVEFEAQDNLKLSIQVAGNKLIRIALPNLRADA